MNPVISFSLFGTNMKYYVGAERNVLDIKKLLPNWEINIYHNNGILPNYKTILNELGANLINVENVVLGNKTSDHFPYFWRFISFLDDRITLVRDLDSRISTREITYINRWLESDCDYFIIRDHPWHSPVPSGLFGIKRKISDFETHLNNYIANNELVWGTDQTILQLYIENIDNNNIYYCGYDDKFNYIPRNDENFFIGIQLDEYDKPTKPSGELCLKYLKDINL
jgi:hypothetical protein